MALEDKPGDRERLDGAFRAFHTLKGAAGIVEFVAMARTLHAAEDLLAKLRSTEEPISSNVLNECLACLDLTSRWLDGMQASGGAPPGAEVDADDMIARLVDSMDAEEDEKSAPPTGGDWLDRLRVAAGDQFSGVLTAVRFVPDPEAFFKGDDPLSIVASLPELEIVDLALTDRAVSLDTMNTFSCSLEVLALAKAPVAEVRKAFGTFADRAELRELARSSVPAGNENYLAQATSVLEAQILLLREDRREGLWARVASAGRTAANVLLYLGRNGPAAKIEQAMGTAQAQRKLDPLIAAIQQVLERETKSEHPTNIPPVQVVAPRALRVDMDRIDALVKLTGELLVVKNAIGHLAKRLQNNEDPAAVVSTLRDQHALFDRLAIELQGAVLRIRVSTTAHGLSPVSEVGAGDIRQRRQDRQADH